MPRETVSPALPGCRPRTPGSPSTVPKMPSGSATPRVLIVDDDQRLADALALVLNQHGFSTTAAYSGTQAIQAALKSPPNFIVMDVMMNGIDGVDAAIAICETLPQCQILLMSGAEDALQRLKKGSRRGHNFELLTKPVLTDSLLDKLRN